MVNGYVNISDYSSKILGEYLVAGDLPELVLEDQRLSSELIELSKTNKIIVLEYKTSAIVDGSLMETHLKLNLTSTYVSIPDAVGAVFAVVTPQFIFGISAESSGQVSLSRVGILN